MTLSTELGFPVAQCLLPSHSSPCLLYFPKQNGRRPGWQIEHDPRKLRSGSLLEKYTGKLGSFPQNWSISKTLLRKGKYLNKASCLHNLLLFIYFTKEKSTRNNNEAYYEEHCISFQAVRQIISKLHVSR